MHDLKRASARRYASAGSYPWDRGPDR